MSNIDVDLGDFEDKALESAKVSPDNIREMDAAQLAAYISEAGPIHEGLMEVAERLMRLARPLNENLFVARNRQIETDRRPRVV